MLAMAANVEVWRCSSAAVTGPPACARMSQSRKTRIPVANALRSPWTGLGRPRSRATGRPRKMVAPAIAPSKTVVAWLIVGEYMQKVRLDKSNAGSQPPSEVVSHYLEAIYYMWSEGEPLRSARLADWLGGSRPTATLALH